MTEKNYNPKQKEKKAMANAAVAEKKAKKETKEIKQTKQKTEIKKDSVEKEIKKETKETSKTTEKAPKQEAKQEAAVNSYNLPISTKKAADICRFIKGKTINQAIKELEEVVKGKKAIPMKGEIPHRKGRIMSGGFPKKAAKEIIVVLKGLSGNANVNEIDNPIISEAIANIGSRPYGRFGRVRRKRTHIKIIAKPESSKIKKQKTSK